MIKSTFILPHPPILLSEIGKGAEKESQAILDAYDAVGKKIKTLKPKTIILITPHGPVFSDGIVIGYDATLKGDLDKFGYKQITLEKENNLPLVEKIIFESGKINVPVLKLNDENSDYFGIEKTLDHGTIVPLKFVDQHYQDYKLVHITYGLFTSAKLYEFGMTLQNCIDEDVVIIASGDMSHCLLEEGPYKFHPSGAVYDAQMIKLLQEKDLLSLMFFDEKLQREAAECGKRSIDIMLGTLDGFDYKPVHYAYEGPFGVGYLVMGFEDLSKDTNRLYLDKITSKQLDANERKRVKESRFVALARRSIEHYLGLREDVMDDSLTPEMLDTRAGVFVSLKKHGALRGCIGTIGPTEDNIALEIVANAVKAGFQDPRFPELEKDEMDELTITVDVLMKPEKIESVDLLDVKKYGVIVSAGYKRGLLLPNLEGIDTVDEQIRIACQKGSITEADDFELERFEVVRYE